MHKSRGRKLRPNMVFSHCVKNFLTVLVARPACPVLCMDARCHRPCPASSHLQGWNEADDREAARSRQTLAVPFYWDRSIMCDEQTIQLYSPRQPQRQSEIGNRLSINHSERINYKHSRLLSLPLHTRHALNSNRYTVSLILAKRRKGLKSSFVWRVSLSVCLSLCLSVLSLYSTCTSASSECPAKRAKIFYT